MNYMVWNVRDPNFGFSNNDGVEADDFTREISGTGFEVADGEVR
jgi:hypothetical protein